MSGLLLIPPTYTDLLGPAVFLAGPIQGAPDWQPQGAALIQERDPELHVCSPRRTIRSGGFSDVMHAEQMDWETFYLRRCGADGVVLVWLAAKDHDVPGREYAQTTRFELAEWKERAMRGEAKFVVGVEDGFSNARYIRRRLSQDCPNVPVCQTLEETCAAAVRLAREPAPVPRKVSRAQADAVLEALARAAVEDNVTGLSSERALQVLAERGLLIS